MSTEFCRLGGCTRERFHDGPCSVQVPPGYPAPPEVSQEAPASPAPSAGPKFDREETFRAGYQFAWGDLREEEVANERRADAAWKDYSTRFSRGAPSGREGSGGEEAGPSAPAGLREPKTALEEPPEVAAAGAELEGWDAIGKMPTAEEFSRMSAILFHWERYKSLDTEAPACQGAVNHFHKMEDAWRELTVMVRK